MQNKFYKIILKKANELFITSALILMMYSCNKAITSVNNGNSGANGSNNNNNSPNTEADSTIYILALNNNNYYYSLFAISATTGAVKWSWSHAQNRTLTYYDVPASISVNGGIVYASLQSTLYAFDTASGSQIWTFNCNTNQTFGSPVVHNNTLYTCASSTTNLHTSSFYALDAITGTIKWQTNYQGIYDVYPVYYNNELYLNTYYGLLVLNATTGIQESLVPITGNQQSIPIIYENTVFTIGIDTNFFKEILYAIDASTKIIKWSTSEDSFSVGTQIFISGNTLYSNSYTNLLGIDLNSKTLISKLFTNGYSDYSVSGSTIYGEAQFGNSLGFVSYNLQNNNINWTSNLYITESRNEDPTISNGTIYVAAQQSYFDIYQVLCALDSATGAVKWTFVPPGTRGTNLFISDAVVVSNSGNIHYSSAHTLRYF